MTKKQTKSKKAGSSRKAEKPAAAKAPRTKERNPRLPAAGTTLTRTYKGKELKVAVLEEGFRFEGEEFRSLTALAREITGYPAISGPAFFRLTGPKDASAEAMPSVKPTTAKARAPRVRRGRRGPQPETPTGAAPAAEMAATA